MSIRDRFAETLTPLALKGLNQMRLQDGIYSDTARLDASGAIRATGRSYRYSAMVLVGLAARLRLGLAPENQIDTLQNALFAWAMDRAPFGDAGLVLWALALSDDPRVNILLESIERRWVARCHDRREIDSMSAGWLLAGLSALCQHTACKDNATALGEQVFQRLLANRNAETGLFCLGGPTSRRNLFARRRDHRLGSFASQAYPTIGLASYARGTGNLEALQVAAETADRLCTLQGSEGQWWWIYDVRTAQPVIRYPVYSVHQDGMGPMALLAVMLAGAERDYTNAIGKSLDWLEKRPELPEERLIDPEHGVVWRAIQRDAPDRTAGFGLGASERLRMSLAAWIECPDRRAFRRGYVCAECRPYHLGWILAADAMAATLEH